MVRIGRRSLIFVASLLTVMAALAWAAYVTIFPLTSMTIINASGATLTDVSVDFEGSVDTEVKLLPGDRITLSRRHVREGTILVKLTLNGDVYQGEFGYITPFLGGSYEVIVMPTGDLKLTSQPGMADEGAL